MPPIVDTRFFKSPRWRWLILDDALAAITCLDSVASNAAVVRNLNAPCSIDLEMPSNAPVVNIPYPDADSDPLVTEGTRFLIGLRRLPADETWECAATGQVLQLGDASLANPARTTITAFDPWMYLYNRPVRNGDGELPGPDGLSYSATRGDVILQQLLQNTYDFDGPHFILTTGAEINATAQIDIVFQQGTSVGEALDQLVATKTIDIVLAPIWSPVGYFDALSNPVIVELQTYVLAGADQYDAVFGWDTAGGSLPGLGRNIDGTQRQNEVVFYDADGVPAAVAQDSASVAKYGEYWAQQFFPGQVAPGAVAAFAASRLALRKDGLRSLTATPSTQRAPVPLRDYGPGDRVQVFATSKFRAPLATLQRVQTIPLATIQSGIEQCRGLLFTDDGWQGAGS